MDDGCWLCSTGNTTDLLAAAGLWPLASVCPHPTPQLRCRCLACNGLIDKTDERQKGTPDTRAGPWVMNHEWTRFVFGLY
jgi:hypothetical protein